MELAILILVNLFGFGVIYFIFALRTHRTLQQVRKDPISPELKENIELTLQYINSALDLLDQKKKTCYQMLRQAEELASPLHAEAKTKTKKKPSKKQKISMSVQKPAQELTTKKTGEPKARPKKKPLLVDWSKDSKQQTQPQQHHPSYNIERALQGLGEDQVEIQPAATDIRDAYLTGSSFYRANKKEEQKNKADRDLNFHAIKSIVPKLLSIGNTWLKNIQKNPVQGPVPQPHRQVAAKEQTKPEPPVTVDFSIDTLPQSNPQRVPTPTQLYQNKFDLASHPPSYSDSSLTLAKLSPIMIEDKKFSNLGQRKDFIHNLLSQGYMKEDIAIAMDIPLAEVHLIASLPQRPNKEPRRKRLNQAIHNTQANS